MQHFLKENWVLIIGILLPILLMIVFILATILPRFWVAPPKYDFLYVAYVYNYNNSPLYTLNVEVRDKKLHVWTQPVNEKTYTSQKPKLYIFENKTQASREIPISVPEQGSNKARTTIIIPELQNLLIDTSEKAPDDYRVYSQNQYNSDLGGLLFSNYDRNNAFLLKKNGYVIKVPFPLTSDYNTRFLGWIINK